MKCLSLTLALLAAAPLAAPAAAANATAAPGESVRTYTFKQKQIEFIDRAGEQLTVSRNCLGKNGALGCAAVKDLAKLSWQTLRAKHPGTQAGGSLLCEEQLKGKVVLGESELGDENAFCRFAKDGSLIDLGSLAHRARQNDEAAPRKDEPSAKAAPAAPAEDQP
jgi:hypothetical protein